MKYVFRLSPSAVERMNEVAPPAHKKRSPFLREALVNFLMKEAQPMIERPHIPGQEGYKQVCAILDDQQIHAVRSVYPEASVSVVIQAAVLTELNRPKYKKQASSGREVNRDDKQDAIARDDSGARGTARKPQATRDKP